MTFTAETKPPMQVWRVRPGDVVRIPGHFPPVVTVTDVDYTTYACDRVCWEAGTSRGSTVLRREMTIELLSTEDETMRPFITAGNEG